MNEVSRYEPVHEDAIAADADGRYVTFADYEAMRGRAEKAEAKAHDFDLMVQAILSLEPNIGKPDPTINTLLAWVKRAQQAERDRDVLATEVLSRREGHSNRIRNAKRGDGTLQAWQKRVRDARDAVDAALALSRCTPAGKEGA